ncbi:hypothetical protein [Maribacter sp. HTCC2170]|uniref:hypothetical protein n=1 Tax=Maribacter sp. (strain HTCC2170 / KCCM 42371) TaxID=313603 RepID=UPI00006BD4E4|nr:hypothetical protein [Maribacter sp. HTCC2170]EAR02128.1 hypothetical protein FB2170_02555 [Maribacter sp. HTCC2170]
MKKIISLLTVSALIFSTFSCEDEDKDRLDVNQITGGAILRTLSSDTPPINSAFPSNSNMSATVEFDDFLNDDTLESVDVFLEFIDATPVNNAVLTFPEAQIATVPGSAFTMQDGKLSTTITANIGDALGTLGIDQSVLYGGDVFLLRLALHTTEGQTFTSTNVGTKIQTSSAFRSPFRYSAAVACPPPANLAGDWIIDMQDSYGDGWNGASITVSAAGVATDYTITGGSSGTATVNAPAGELFTFTFNSGAWDSEITYQITDPLGNVVADHGPTPSVGPISLTVDFCAP